MKSKKWKLQRTIFLRGGNGGDSGSGVSWRRSPKETLCPPPPSLALPAVILLLSRRLFPWAKFPVMRTLRIESRRFVGVSLRVRYKEWVGGKGEAGELEWRRSKLGWFSSRGFFVRGILQLQQRRILVFLPLKSDMWCAGKEKMRLVFLTILDEVSGDCLCPGRNSRMKEE